MELLDQRGFFERALSANSRSALAPVFRALMRPAGWAYARVLAHRRRAYHEGRLTSFALGAPVISVGNLTAGGTGKTPMVEWIAQWCLRNGRHPAILSRGYRARNSSPAQAGAVATPRNDEALLLDRNVPGARQYPNPDRFTAGRRAITDGADCLILDDGFQHLRVKRDLNLALIDALDPFGGGRVLPAGTLREPIESLADADAVIITRVDAVGKKALQIVRQRIRDLLPEKAIFETQHRPARLTLPGGGAAEELDWLRGRRVFLFCGLGNPDGFVQTIEKLGAEVVAARFLPDHCAYSARDLERLAEECIPARADCALTTEKDAVKIGAWPGTIPLRVVRVEIEFIPGPEPFVKLLKSVLTR